MSTPAPVPFAINGLGRIGRALLRIAESRGDLCLVAANDQADPRVLARLLAHDTLHGRFPGTVAADGEALVVNARRVPLFGASSPAEIPWARAAEGGLPTPWLVVESTGRFRTRELAGGHLADGTLSKVVVSATAGDVDATFCVGVNHRAYDAARHHVVSNASCTANCLVAVAAVLESRFGIRHGFMNTVHCYTNSQNLVDMAHVDPRRARAAALNLIPTSTDAVEGLALVLPQLAGRVSGMAVRAPVPDGSLLDFVVRLSRPASADAVRDAFRDAAEHELAGVLAVTDEELVSSDFIGSPYSATVDLPLIATLEADLVRVCAWYDNEWGYANRLADLIVWMGAPDQIARERALVSGPLRT